MDEEAVDEGPGTEELLASYRERKRKALQEAQQRTPSAASPAPVAAPPPARAAEPVLHAARAPPQPSAPPLPASPSPAVSPVAAASPPAAAPPTGRVPVTAAPAPPGPPAAAASPPVRALVAHSPGPSSLGSPQKLSEALLSDRAVTTRGSVPGRVLGFVLLLLGLTLVAIDQRSVYLGGARSEAAGIGVFLLGVASVLLGGLLLALFSFVPTRRRLAVRLAPTQAEEWRRVQAQAKRLELLVLVGAGLALVGAVLAAVAYSGAPEGLVAALAALGALLAVAGLATAAVAAVRRGLVRRLYVQTLVLSGLERSGVGASDGRVAPVLLALDELLGALPPEQVTAFLASPQAQAYLDLIEEAGRTHGK